ncbi:MAG: ABC transporter transmembrane domain-containing protein [Candidatus Gracilibacteria bacterium]|nr:ABC transporter transmembrane domain-containing protein [Candidatus Gracilibacteria bacterium]
MRSATSALGVKKERTFKEILKRFTNPYLENKIVTIKSLIFYSFWAIFPIVHIYFAQRIVENIENKDKNAFIFTLSIYIGILCFNYISMYLIKNWSYISNIASFRNTIHNLYLKNFITLSNTEVEKVGTGKLISIIGTGMDTWAILLNRLLEHFLKIVCTLIFTFIMIAIVNIWLAIIFLILYVIMHIIGEYFNKKTVIFRRLRQNAWNDYTGHIVKMIMSKFEILQTGKIKKEIEITNQYNSNMLMHSLNLSTPNYFFFYIPSIFINTVKILMFIFLGFGVINGEVTIAFFVAMFGVLTLMNQVIINSMIFYSDFTKDFTKNGKNVGFFGGNGGYKMIGKVKKVGI